MEEKTRQTFLKLRWCELVVVVLMWLPCVVSVTLDGNYYQDLYVALSPDLPESECESSVASLETVLSDTSALLFSVSGTRVQFPSAVHVVLPSSYTTCGTYFKDAVVAPLGYSYLQAPLRLDRNHSLFGAAIWTQQPRQCGQEGDFISFTPDSVRDNTLAARQLVKEWAKFRWGVMEEVGHEGDFIYPPAYQTPQGTYYPTVCVDTPLSVSESDCSSEQQCFYNSEINDNQTSSIISVPDLPNVTEMCTASTHNSEAPTKQNVLCSGLSADQVFQQHSDYRAQQMGSNHIVPKVSATVSIENPITSSVVIAVEYTTRMFEYEFEFEYVLDVLCQSLEAFLEDGVDFGILLFDNTGTTLVGATELVKLNVTTKNTICAELEKVYRAQNITDSTRKLSLPITRAAELLPSSGGSVVLLTRPLSTEAEDVTSVAAMAGVNVIWPMLYPYDKEDLTWYETLSTLTGSDQVRSVHSVCSLGSCQAIMREQLSQNLVEIFSLNQDDQLETLSFDSGLVPGNKTCSMTHDIDLSEAADVYIVSVYYSDRITSVTLGPGNLGCEDLGSISPDTSWSLSCSSLPETLSVTVVMVQGGKTIYSDVVGKTIFNSSLSATSAGLPGGEGIFVWASNGLRDLQFTNTSAPAVFAQVFLEGRQVLEASVLAVVTRLASSSSVPETLNLTLLDAGVGADVTGNDGIYSSFISFSSGNNTDISTLELSFDISASGPAYFMPNETVDPTISCCGSLLPLPALDRTPDFFFNTTAQGRVTSPPPRNLSPGRITDLRATSISAAVRLTFTAPGADQDAGTVSRYLITTLSSAGDVAGNHTVSNGIVPAGSPQVLDLSSDIVGCGEVLSYVVFAFDELDAMSDPSNSVKHEISCSTDDYLSAGAIVGIVIGVLILILLILLILYLACNWKRRDELSIWRCLTCNNSPQDKDKKMTGDSKVLASSKRPTSVQMIKTLGDLYARSDGSNNGVSNAGFDGAPSQTAQRQPSNQRKGSLTSYGSRTLEKFNMPYDLRDSTLQTTLPINKVGIPVPEQTPSRDMQSSFIASTRSSPAPSYTIYPNYPPNSSGYGTKVHHSESLPEYTTYNRSSPYSDQRPDSASSLATTRSNLNTLV